MKKYESLANEEHVMRRVGKDKQHRENDNFIHCLPQAFALRDKLPDGKPEKDLSVTRLEHFPEPRKEQIKKAASITVQKIGKNDVFAIANVGIIHTICAKKRTKVRIIHFPTQNNPAHTSICDLPRNDLELCFLLASEAFTEIITARKLLAH